MKPATADGDAVAVVVGPTTAVEGGDAVVVGPTTALGDGDAVAAGAVIPEPVFCGDAAGVGITTPVAPEPLQALSRARMTTAAAPAAETLCRNVQRTGLLLNRALFCGHGRIVLQARPFPAGVTSQEL